MADMGVISEECIIGSKRFEKAAKDDKNYQKVGEKCNRIIDELAARTVGGKYRNHKLSGIDCNELHIDGDVLLIWKYYTINKKTFLLLLDVVDHDTLSATNYNKTIKRLIKMAENVAAAKTSVQNNNFNESIANEEFINNINKFIEDLYNLRKESITKDGEFGIGNLIFKEFRNKGYLDKLKELKIELENKEMSLENLQN